MRVLPWILVILLVLAVLFLWNRQQEGHSLPYPDTIEYVETIPVYYPIPKDSVIIRYKTVKLPVKKDSSEVKKDSCEAKQDSCVSSDSANVVIPITQKEYEDSLFHLWVSGYDVSIDSFKLNARVREIKVPVPTKRKRWGLGIQAGYGYPSGWYVGVGVSCNLFQW